MTDCKKVFLDTTPIIYFLDNNDIYGEKVQRIFEALMEEEKEMVSSVVTCKEYLVFAYKGDNKEKEEAFFDFMYGCNIPLYEVNVSVAKKAAQIRAEYKHFKGMDALQLAVADLSGCDIFLTNDKQLKQYKEIKVVLVDEFDYR